MSLPIKKDQVAEGLGRLISLWKDKPNIQGLVTSYLREVQELEDVWFQLLNERNVFTAIGAQLDVIGTYVGESRDSRNDDDYRDAILNRVARNNSDGTPESIIQLISAATGSPVVQIWEHYPASMHVYVDRGANNSTPTILETATAAGVSSRLMFDVMQNSFIGAATIQDNFDLALENDDELEVFDGVDLADLEVISTTFVSTGNRSYLPHSLNTEVINPLCVTLGSEQFFTEVGDLALENEDLIELENGDTLQYQTAEEL